MTSTRYLGVTPLACPDIRLAKALSETAIFPVLHLGSDTMQGEAAMRQLCSETNKPFGVCMAHTAWQNIQLPQQVCMAIIPFGITLQHAPAQVFCQVHTLAEANAALAQNVHAIILKGHESGGTGSDLSTFIFFQQVMAQKPAIPVFVQGGIGVHNAAAFLALGAAGVVFDNQLALFPECSLPATTKAQLEKLNGSETRVIDHYRILVRPNSPTLPDNISATMLAQYSTTDIATGFLPLGQDITIGAALVQRYKKLNALSFALQEAAYGHLRQAKSLNILGPENALAKDLGIDYPIAQGPMTRVSDVPAFAAAVANAGALPFVALSLLKGDNAKQLIAETKQQAGNNTWGVGILGFAPAELRNEQLEYILQEKPPVVLIAGGQPAQAKPLEQAGIQTFLHVPSLSLLDIFLKEGARKFVFEGRECGGHVGPLSSMVLWELQVERLLKLDDPKDVSVFFAGGIHDDFSAAFVAVMAAPLAAKGAKLGVLVGTAYLFTKEAVETGAILPQFQQQAVLQQETVLLETAPGHETRCLNSPFVDFFRQQKQAMQQQGLDKKEIWARLEQLNVGRLRIAAKGIERRGSVLVERDETAQFSEGMFMIGQVAGLRKAIIGMDELHANISAQNYIFIQEALLPEIPKASGKPLDIAIVGMACVYPGARDLDEFWTNILTGKDSVTEVPDERWNKAVYYDPQSNNGEKSPSKWGGFVPALDFDPLEFGIPPQSLAAIEPSQLLSLLIAKRALEHAGYADGSFNGDNVSVIIGAEGGNDLANSYGFRAYYPQVFGEMPAELAAALPRMTEDSFPGVLANVIAGRITNRLNLGGRNFTVDAACASSLAAIDLACQELLLEKSDMVIAGGADLHNGINDYLMFSSTHALSRKGRCATFDSGADGIALGEGVAMMVLKRLDDAQRDGDKIYAVIKGVGGSSDGKSLGLTAPRKAGQERALERAYAQAGISPAAAGLVEAHGTGTVVGDKTELTALTGIFLQSGAITGQTTLGSVKSQIGHTKCAAGLAGLIKAALSVYHGVKPATLHLHAPNAFYDAATSPFVFTKQAGTWNSSQRVAGISAFGFGGTNFHAVIENHLPAIPASSMETWPAELFVFRGSTTEEVWEQATSIVQLIKNNEHIKLRDIAYTLCTFSQKPIQFCIVAATENELCIKISQALAGATEKGIHYAKPVEGKTAFLFSGQGSQRINMARELFVAFPAMRSLLAQYPAYEAILFPPASFNNAAAEAQKQVVKDTRNAQPLLGMVDHAIASFFKNLGVEADMVAGHSYGELPALCFAGAFSPAHLVPLSEQRALSILNGAGEDKGAMVAVTASVDMLQTLLQKVSGVYAVNYNSPKQIVVAGTTAGIQQLMELLKSRQLSYKQLEVACAFHSPVIAGAKDLFAAVLEKVDFSEPVIPVWSNTSAGLYATEPARIKATLAQHLVTPVLFATEIEQMYAAGARIFIEMGPGKTLAGLTRSILGKNELVLHTEEAGQEAIPFLLNTVAAYAATGKAIQLEKLFEGRTVQTLQILEPELYKKSAAIWHVNGHNALPSTGKLPDHGALPIVRPIQLSNQAKQPTIMQPNTAAEQMMLEYLNTMRSLVQAQRDVMLGYLGVQQGTIPAAAKAHAIPLQPAQNTPQAVVVVPPVLPVNAAPVTVSAIEIKTVLLQVVSDKTGYPIDMLAMDADLEADLSIDSIKRLEIIAALKQHIGQWTTHGKSETVLQEQLATIKTLHGLLNWLQEHTTSTKPASTAQQAVPAGSVLTKTDITTMILATVSGKTGYPQDMLGLELDLEADLSIDSIKRLEIVAELKTKLGIDADMNAAAAEQLAAIKTLNNLVNWVAALQTVSTPQKAAATGMEQAIASLQNAAIDSISIQEIQATLLQIVSDKTGYPIDMLGMHLDLEADLSIDSIKRLEIFAELKSKIQLLNLVPGGKEDAAGQTAAVKTLQGLVNWIAEAISIANEPVKEARRIIHESAVAAAPREQLKRLKQQVINAMRTVSKESLAGKRFAITDDGNGVSATIKYMLEQQGATAVIITVDTNLDTYDGLIFLNLFTAPLKNNMAGFFSLVKTLDAAKVKWLLVISDLRSHIIENNNVDLLRHVQGYAGFIKSLDKEWEQTKCRLVALSSKYPDEKIAAFTLNELMTDDTHAEVIYQNDERKVVEWIPADVLVEGGQKTRLELDTNAVILVFGGAQGITARLINRVSQEYPCNIILVGRSVLADDTQAYQQYNSKESIKQQLIKEGRFGKPSDIEYAANNIYKQNQIRENIARLQTNGASVQYVPLDVRNEAQLTTLIQDTYSRYGRIDGVIHGAGLLEDKLFQNKTLESFERVFTTKVTPLRVLAEQLKTDTKFIILFSSVASVYGNRGQTDYAAANSVMDHYAWELKRKFSGRVMAINWGPWKGTGMVSPTLEKEYERRGIALIPLNDGMELFVKELKYGTDNQVLIMADTI